VVGPARGGFDPDLLDHASRQRYWMIQSFK
jgi:hypothetical protein